MTTPQTSSEEKCIGACLPAARNPHPTYLIIGHISKDIVDGARLGGSFSYASVTARNLGERVGGITSIGPDLSPDETLAGIDVVTIPSPTTTTFQNLYSDGHREQFIRAVANRIEPEHVPDTWRAADIVHLAPIAQEVSPAIAQLFPQSFIGVTPQGWMRRWDADGRVSRVAWAGADLVLKRADAVVMSEEDVVGGEKRIRTYARHAKLLVVTRGANGAALYHQGRVRHFPAFPAREVDPTGAGDAFAAAFFIKLRRSGDPSLAMRFASCVASFVVEGIGLSGVPTIEQVNRRLIR